MKIGNPADAAALAPLTQGTAAATDTAKSARPAATPAAGAADPSAKVALSTTVESLRAGSASADFDAEKVAKMQQAIANGTFQVNAEVIADKLIANAQEVLGRVQRG
jgi:negative regulator of flagellin synthesis FlgM